MEGEMAIGLVAVDKEVNATLMHKQLIPGNKTQIIILILYGYKSFIPIRIYITNNIFHHVVTPLFKHFYFTLCGKSYWPF